MSSSPKTYLLIILVLTTSLFESLMGVTISNAQDFSPRISAVAWSPDGTQYATGDYYGNVKIWNASTGLLVQTFEAPDFNLRYPPLITSINWNPDGNRLAATGSASTQPTAYLWTLDLTTGETVVFDAESLTYTATWSPDGTMLAAGVTEGNASYGEHWVKVWNAASQQLVANLEGYSDVILSVAWSPDGTRLATCSADATGAIWETNTFTRLLTFGEFPTYPVLWGSWSPDGTRLATTSVHGTALIWDAETGQLVMTLNSDDSASMYEIVWSPDGSQLAGVSEYAIKVWDSVTGSQIGRLKSAKSMDTLAWSPDGSALLYAGIGFTQAHVVDPSTFVAPDDALPVFDDLETSGTE